MKFNQKTIPYLFMSLLCISYVIIRAWNLGAWNDEILTLRLVIPTNIYDAPVFANNHLLNSFLIKMLYGLFDHTLFVARIPTLLSFLLYLYFGYRIASHLSPTWMGYCCFFLLVCNPFLLEYYGVARGYGLSIAFMMASIHYALENVRSYSFSRQMKSLIWGAFAVISIFSMIYFWIVLAFVLNLLVFLREERTVLKRSMIGSAWIGLGIFSLIVVPIVRLIQNEKLFVGGLKDVYRDTLLSLLNNSVGANSHPPETIFLLIILTLFFVFVIGLSYIYKKPLYSVKNFMLIILLGIFIVMTFFHYTINIRYPVHRVALFLYPLLALCFLFSVNELRKYMRWGIMSVVILLATYNLVLNANLDSAITNSAELHASKVLDALNEKGKRSNKTIKVGYLDDTNTWSYYVEFAQKEKYSHIRLFPSRDLKPTTISPEVDHYILWYEPYELRHHPHRVVRMENLIRSCPKDTARLIMSFPKDDLYVYEIISKSHDD